MDIFLLFELKLIDKNTKRRPLSIFELKLKIEELKIN